jgi:hypothetical protein
MKAKLFLWVLLLVAVVPGALAAPDAGETNAQTPRGNLLVTPVEEPATQNVPTSPAVVANDPKQELQDYDSLMIAITQKFSATLAAVAEAAKRGQISGEQAKEMSAEQYQLTHMQFELISLWRGIQEQDSTKTPDLQPGPDPNQKNDIVVVALPFSSFQLNPSLAEYLNLTPSQANGIQQVMKREQRTLDPLMNELRITQEKLLAIGSDNINEKELKALADREASVFAKIIVANARMQSKIYEILSPDQQQKLVNLERMQGAGPLDCK